MCNDGSFSLPLFLQPSSPGKGLLPSGEGPASVGGGPRGATAPLERKWKVRRKYLNGQPGISKYYSFVSLSDLEMALVVVLSLM